MLVLWKYLFPVISVNVLVAFKELHFWSSFLHSLVLRNKSSRLKLSLLWIR